jgi:hypothetical protein
MTLGITAAEALGLGTDHCIPMTEKTETLHHVYRTDIRANNKTRADPTHRFNNHSIVAGLIRDIKTTVDTDLNNTANSRPMDCAIAPCRVIFPDLCTSNCKEYFGKV